MRRRGHRYRRGLRSGTQLDGTTVAVVAWCRVLRVAAVVAVISVAFGVVLLLTVHLLSVVDGCCGGVGGGVVVCCLLLVVLMRCVVAVHELLLEPKKKAIISYFNMTRICREESRSASLAVSSIAHASEAKLETSVCVCVFQEHQNKYSLCRNPLKTCEQRTHSYSMYRLTQCVSTSHCTV